MACGLWTHARQSSRKMASSIVTHELQLLRGLLGATHTHKRRESPLQSVIRPFHRPHIMRLYIRSVISVLFAIYWCETHAVDAWYITFISCRSFETIHYEAHSLGDLSAGTLHLILQQFISVRYEEVKPDSFSTGKFFSEFLERMNETHAERSWLCKFYHYCVSAQQLIFFHLDIALDCCVMCTVFCDLLAQKQNVTTQFMARNIHKLFASICLLSHRTKMNQLSLCGRNIPEYSFKIVPPSNAVRLRWKA